NGARFGGAARGTGGIRLRLQMRGKHMDVFRVLGHADLRLEQVACESGGRIGVAEGYETHPVQPLLRTHNRETAGDDAPEKAVSAGIRRQKITGQIGFHKVGHLITVGKGDFLERDDVRMQVNHLARWPGPESSSCSNRSSRSRSRCRSAEKRRTASR